mmetsp:Transcript_65197/g.190761  ORF Transcript_65197/g.190761 Transcript_65197/m.190761 type:complete len:95 (-) Transcript_65197:160-444(-)
MSAGVLPVRQVISNRTYHSAARPDHLGPTASRVPLTDARRVWRCSAFQDPAVLSADSRHPQWNAFLVVQPLYPWSLWSMPKQSMRDDMVDVKME